MSYPKAPDKKIQKLSNLLTKYAEINSLEFCFGEDEIYPAEVFSFFGGLSLFLIEAKELYEKLYNNLFTYEDLMQGIGKNIKELSLSEFLEEKEFLKEKPKKNIFPTVFLENPEDTYFGFIPREDKGLELYLISHFTIHVVDEYAKQYKNNPSLLINGKIPLDPLYEKMIDKVNNKEIIIIPNSKLINTVNKSD